MDDQARLSAAHGARAEAGWRGVRAGDPPVRVILGLAQLRDDHGLDAIPVPKEAGR